MQLHCTCITSLTNLVDGSLEVKLPTIWTDGKAEVGRVREEKRREEEKKKEDQRRERVRRNKIKVREKVEKSRRTRCFSNVLWLCRLEKSQKVGSLKRRVRSHLGR